MQFHFCHCKYNEYRTEIGIPGEGDENKAIAGIRVKYYNDFAKPEYLKNAPNPFVIIGKYTQTNCAYSTFLNSKTKEVCEITTIGFKILAGSEN